MGDKTSLSSQQTRIAGWCDRNSHTIVRLLQVPGQSRNYDNLYDIAKDIPAYQELIELIKAQAFDVLAADTVDRLARDVALLPQVIQRVIRSGARIYLIDGGWIDESNYMTMIAILSLQIAAPVQAFTRKTKQTKRTLIQKGIPWGGVSFSLMSTVRDKNGKRISTIPNASLMPVFECAVRLLVNEDHTFSSLPDELARRGFVRSNGKPFLKKTLMNWFYHPYTWGNMATGQNGLKKVGLWFIDGSEPAPDGIEVFYGTHEPLLDEGMRELLLGRLKQIRAISRGKGDVTKASRFHALLQCGDCGCVMHVGKNHPKKDGTRYMYWRCAARYNGVLCTNRRTIRDELVFEQIDAFLRLTVEQGDLPVEDNRESTARRMAQLESERDTIETAIRDLIRLQVNAGEIAYLYTEQIDLERRKLSAVKHEIGQLRPKLMQSGRYFAIQELTTMGVDKLWEQEDTRINQFLHRLMDGYQFVVSNGKITTIAEGRLWSRKK